MDYIIDKIIKSQVQCDPWPHIVIDNFLSQEHYQELYNCYQSVNWKDKDFQEEESNWCPTKYAEMQSKVVDFLRSKKVSDVVFKKFNKDIDLYITHANYKLDTEKHTLQKPHCDSSFAIATMQIFLQKDSYLDGGTVLMKTCSEETKELPLKSNSCTIFLNSKNSWHYVKQRGYIRKSYLQRWTILPN